MRQELSHPSRILTSQYRSRDMIPYLTNPNLKQTALVIALASLASLLSAWFIQYALGYAPCQLCYAQRWPYYLGMALGGAAWLSARSGAIPLCLMLVGALAVVMLIGAGLAVYHSGVEWKFWPGPSSCTTGITVSTDITDMMAQVNKARVVPCDQPPFRLLGLSPANANVLISLAFAAYCLYGFALNRPGRGGTGA